MTSWHLFRTPLKTLVILRRKKRDEIVKNFFGVIAKAKTMKNSLQDRSPFPSLRAIQRNPHSALPFLDLAMARASKGRLDCELLCIAEAN